MKVIEQHEHDAVDLNIEQMLSGKDSNDQQITPQYTPLTVKIKKEKGQPYDHVTLKDEGDFQSEMFMDAKQFPIMFGSKDSKEGLLTEKYGSDIFGLDRKSKKDFAGDIKPDVVSYYRGLLSV